ncbi:MAG TPA: glutathione S-transferase family protein [Solirubrobacteraceae bacterium]|jgi:glutathione S-transferase
MKLYHREHAGRPIRVAWTLEEAGQPYELVRMSSDEGKGPEHLDRHPLGKVPVLDDDQGYVFESAAICMHLADLNPQAELMPAPGTHERALVYQWAVFAPSELEPTLLESAIWAERDPERSAKAAKRFADRASAVSVALGDNDYLLAGTFTVADILVATALEFARRAGLADAVSAGNLDAYLERARARPAFQRAYERAAP